MSKNSKHLRIASIIQLLFGIGYVIFIQLMLEYGEINLDNIKEEEAFFALIIAYLTAFLSILAGVVGLVKSNKKSILTVIFGLILFIPQLINFINVKNDTLLIVVNIIALVIPYYYLHNAWKNYKLK